MSQTWTDAYRGCALCPRVCGADRAANQRGFCGADDQAYVARAALHAWEEPPISGTRGSGTIFFSHCTLGCVFCQNRVISRRADSGKAVSAARLAGICLELQAQGAHNVNLVTPMHYAPTVHEALVRAKAGGLTIPIVCNTGGYENLDTIRRFEGLIDIYLPDFKYYSSYYAGLYAAAPDYADCARAAIEEMVRQTGAPILDGDGLLVRGTIIRHLMLPSLAGDTAQVLRCIAERWGDRVLVSLMRQYTPFGMEDCPELNRRITDAEYDAAVQQFEVLGLAGFLQDEESISESFIPAFDGAGV